MLVEFAGTPCSGKDSTINRISASWSVNCKFRTIRVVDETIKKVLDRDNLLGSNILSVFYCLENIRALQESYPDSDRSLFLINRGLFDRLAFIRLYGQKDSVSRRIAESMETSILLSDELANTDTIFLFLTSPEKAIERKMHREHSKSDVFRTVNNPIIRDLNSHYLDLYYELVPYLPIILVDDLYKDTAVAQKVSLVEKNIRRISRND